MLNGTCLCGAAGWTFQGRPERATVCNCGACRRYGAVWAYGTLGESIGLLGKTRSFVRPDGDGALAFRFCPACGTVLAWTGTGRAGAGGERAAVNLRAVVAPDLVHDVPIRRFDGRDSWTAADGLPPICLRDLWI